MRSFPFPLTDEAHEYLIRGITGLAEYGVAGFPHVAELCWRSGSVIEAGGIETFGLCAADTLDLNSLEIFELEGKPIRVSITLQERYRGRLLTVGSRRAPERDGGRVRELYFL